ncbi:hypothetical protein DESPIGER_0359 [Desulfovibrio piger]|uniref:Uncharacterized protein n=1 Tax=Desulfovibrio piger TaxID=901 RepID=A0A1K1LC15_9BACT|nr:hypothetical protein DESPIGER_0359 [Desulfovibrio piger]
MRHGAAGRLAATSSVLFHPDPAALFPATFTATRANSWE